MICYIYHLINSKTGERYVGQTTNFSRRKQEHLLKLKENRHPNQKLQNAWNKYGEENFYFEKKRYDISKQELDQLEIDTIKKYNSFSNGYNLTEGGTGGNTRGTLTFEEFCLVYFGNKKYPGAINKSAKLINKDSSTVSAIVRDLSYDVHRQKAQTLSKEEKERYIQIFEEKLDIKNNPIIPQKKKLSDDDIIIFLSLKSWYGRGIEAAYIKQKNISKGLGYHLKKGEYLEAQRKFSLLSDEEIISIAEEYFNSNDLGSYNSKKITKNSIVKRPLCDCAL